MNSEQKYNILTVYKWLLEEDKLSPDDEQEYIARQLQELSDILMDTKSRGRSLIEKISHSYSHRNLGHGKIHGIYMYGGVGRGKSMLMDLFYDTINVRRKKRVHFHSFMLDIHDRLNKISADNPDEIDPLKKIVEDISKESWLICFDELQVTDIADAMILGRLFKGLFEKNVVIVVTSNRPPDDLYKDGLQRDQFLPFIEIFKSKLNIHSLDGKTDYRLKRIKGLSTVYFTPLGKKSETFLANGFSELIRKHEPRSTTLVAQGRKLKVNKMYKDVALFTFAELCEKPLGSADYIEISKQFNTIFLSDIPKMGPENRNEAKRFVTLIDELYEHKVKLICTAEANPTDLYSSGDFSFEFERTSSRLIEMQSAEYLGKQHIS